MASHTYNSNDESSFACGAAARRECGDIGYGFVGGVGSGGDVGADFVEDVGDDVSRR